MPDYQIRKARPSDIDAIIELCKDHAKFEGTYYDKTGKSDQLSSYIFNENSLVNCLVVEVDEQIKGYATFMPEFSTWDAAYYLHMDCLYLKPEMRGKGLGIEIMNLIRKKAKSADYVNVQWQTPVNNFKAVTFYKKIGATPKYKVRFYLGL